MKKRALYPLSGVHLTIKPRSSQNESWELKSPPPIRQNRNKLLNSHTIPSIISLPLFPNHEIMRNLLLFLLALASFGTLHAQSQRDSIAVYAKVMDSFTHEMLKGVKVEVLHPDSSLVSQHNTDKNYSYGRSSYNFGDEFRGLFLLRADYIFRFSKEGYVTQYANLYKRDLGRREQRRSVGEIMMKKVGKHRDIELGAAEVRTSKIRMVVKGDTLIYNADAF